MAPILGDARTRSAPPDGRAASSGARESAPSAQARGAQTYSNALVAGEYLDAGESIVSSNGSYSFEMQGDGNAVIYVPGAGARWATNTSGNPGARMVMQNDGTLVVYAASGRALWQSNRPAPAPPRPADQDCKDFPSRAAAQNFFEFWAQWYGDFAGLDANHNGDACEDYRY